MDITWEKDSNGKFGFEEVKGSERIVPCELALLAIGFTGAEKKGVVKALDLPLD